MVAPLPRCPAGSRECSAECHFQKACVKHLLSPGRVGFRVDEAHDKGDMAGEL